MRCGAGRENAAPHSAVFVRLHLDGFLPQCGRVSKIWGVASNLTVDEQEEDRGTLILEIGSAVMYVCMYVCCTSNAPYVERVTPL